MIHKTRGIKPSIVKLEAGIRMCFPFLVLGTAQQLAGLRILICLLERSTEIMEQFNHIHGLSILFHLLKKDKEQLTMETFDILFDFACDGVLRQVIQKFF